jgi:hypothetical protein
MRWLHLGALGGVLALASPAFAMPVAPTKVCEVYPDAPVCATSVPACAFCHQGNPPPRNSFGAQVEANLLPGAPRPLSVEDFVGALGTALQAVEGEDADGDGVSNLVELMAGTLPGDGSSFPKELGCDEGGTNPSYDVCAYDPDYAFKKINLDFCGRSPTWEALETFRQAGDKKAALHAELTRCLDSEFWLGQDGQVWQLAHRKIKPLQAIKAGDDAGPIPLGDYYDDYALFVYSQIDDHDAREVLTANYFVTRRKNPTRYEKAAASDPIGDQDVAQEFRAGVLTTRWNLVLNVMFTAVPRTAAAQALRGYLGIDIAKQQGIMPVANEPQDYDAKGVTASACAVCHSTLDPATYPFTRYQGLTGDIGTYDPNRIQRSFRNEGPRIGEMPETGVLFGQPVNDLMEWAQVAANSDAFAAATVTDYWHLVMGREVQPEELEEFTALWQAFRGRHNYSVEKMLHQLIETEAYGVP